MNIDDRDAMTVAASTPGTRTTGAPQVSSTRKGVANREEEDRLAAAREFFRLYQKHYGDPEAEKERQIPHNLEPHGEEDEKKKVKPAEVPTTFALVGTDAEQAGKTTIYTMRQSEGEVRVTRALTVSGGGGGRDAGRESHRPRVGTSLDHGTLMGQDMAEYLRQAVHLDAAGTASSR